MDDDVMVNDLVEYQIRIGEAVMRRMVGSSVRVPMLG
jgi:hypothetical protein